jgi:hypothetical protein
VAKAPPQPAPPVRSASFATAYDVTALVALPLPDMSPDKGPDQSPGGDGQPDMPASPGAPQPRGLARFVSGDRHGRLLEWDAGTGRAESISLLQRPFVGALTCLERSVE